VPDVRPWLRAARAFLLTSYYEGYAAVIVEALGAGRPVVSTDCTAAARELLTSAPVGLVAPIGDVSALAEGLRQVLAKPAPDPHVLASLVADYRIGPISDAYLQVFDTVVAVRLGAASAAPLKTAARVFAIPVGRPAPAMLATPQAAWRRSA
jgi:glycosyltransferase involved in cell wall biosynthesis